MKATDYTVKISVIDAKIKVLQAQRAELVHKKSALAEKPVAKRTVPKKPSLKKTTKPKK